MAFCASPENVETQKTAPEFNVCVFNYYHNRVFCFNFAAIVDFWFCFNS